MHKSPYFFVLLIFFFPNVLTAQISGIVTNKQKEPLPFASIYEKGTSKGTTSNMEGRFELVLEDGDYKLVFQYVGYKQKTIEISAGKEPIELEVVLEEESINLSTIEIKANAEDPAYEIIRKVIAKRKYYQEQVEEFKCDVYVKGNIKILNAPEKILGQEIGDFDGNLDTTRQGIVYLSESESILNYKHPGNYKEVMVSSKVSGNDQGFSFNNAMSMELDLYANHVFMGRNITSPISNSAFAYYKFKLLGTTFDESGRLINKIQFTPKRSEDPVVEGVVYINEDLWNIQSADFFLTGKSAHMPFFDTLFVKQVFVPVKEPDVWRIFSRTYSFDGGFFSFKYQGNWVGVYKNYDLEPEFEDGFFDNEVLKVEEGANKKDSLYWERERPIPLTQEEEVDYVKKDSIQEVRQSKVYLDSIDRVNNAFKFGDLLSGYTFSRSYQKKFFSVSSPIRTIQFNTVQGINADLNIGYRQNFDDYRAKWIRIGGKINYGFSEKELRLSGNVIYNFNRKNFSRLSVEGGRTISQFNRNEPISPTFNTVYTLFFRENYMKLYDKRFFKVAFRREIKNGVLLDTDIEFADRNELFNRSDYSFFYEDSRLFSSNRPLNSHVDPNAFLDSKALTFNLSLRLRINQKYYTYPNRKVIEGSKFPNLWIRYRKGIPLRKNSREGIQSQVDYDLLVFQIEENYFSTGLMGWGELFAEFGWFARNNSMFFQDYRHFNGNELEVFNANRYRTSFLKLPYYEYSSARTFTQIHYQQHLDGFLLDKLPLIRKLQWTTVLGAHFLYTSEKKDYLELSVGIDNLGFKLFRLFRFDLVASFKEGEYQGLGWVVGLKLF